MVQLHFEKLGSTLLQDLLCKFLLKLGQYLWNKLVKYSLQKKTLLLEYAGT